MSSYESGRKRLVRPAAPSWSPSDGNDTSSGSISEREPESSTQQQESPTQKKKRRSTFARNKDEKEKILDELQYLEARVVLLRQEAGYSTSPQLLQEKVLNADLRDATVQQNIMLASIQSSVSGFLVRLRFLAAVVLIGSCGGANLVDDFLHLQTSNAVSPLDTYIHLTDDWTQRRELLLGMKASKLDVATRFLTERTRHLNPLKEGCEMSRFETDNGDLYLVKVDVKPFTGAKKSARQLFSAMHFHFVNLEISMSEVTGNIAIRENDEEDAAKSTHTLQHRLVVAESSPELLVDTNMVLFLDPSGLEAVSPEKQTAIAMMDFVDRDDLYPYSPRQRLRKDVISVVKLSAHRRVTDKEHESDDDELVIALMWWSLVRLHRPEFEVSVTTLCTLLENVNCSVDMVLSALR